MRYDIGLEHGNDDGVLIRTDQVARAIMTELPVEHRESLVRSIDNAAYVLTQGDLADSSMQILRGRNDEGATITLSLLFQEPDEDSIEMTMLLTGAVTKDRMTARSRSVEINGMPSTLTGQLTEGRDIREVVDCSLLEGLRIAGHTIRPMASMTGSTNGNRIEIMLSPSPHEDIDEILHEWMKRS